MRELYSSGCIYIQTLEINGTKFNYTIDLNYVASMVAEINDDVYMVRFIYTNGASDELVFNKEAYDMLLEQWMELR